MAKLHESLGATKTDLFNVAPEKCKIITDKNDPLYDPRTEYAIDENMVRNIMVRGVITPIIIRKDGDDIIVVDGRQRVKNCIEANRRRVEAGELPYKIQAKLISGDEKIMLGVMVSSNEIRQENTAFVRGEIVRKMTEAGMTDAEIAINMGCTTQTVNNLRIADELPSEIKTAVNQKELSVTAAVEIAKSGLTRLEQVEAVEKLKESGEKPTVEKVKATVRNAAESPENKPAPKMRTRREIEAEIERLRGDLNPVYMARSDALRWVLGKNI